MSNFHIRIDFKGSGVVVQFL